MTATQAPTPGPLTAAIDMLSEARDFIDRFSDVIDGDYGTSEPNAAMVMVHEINATIDHLSAPTAPVEASGQDDHDLKLIIAHTIIEDLRVQHPGIEQIDNERGDIWLPGGSTPQSSGCIIDIHSVAQSVEQQVLAALRPGHTDLMVSPENIDAFLEANPPPVEASGSEREHGPKCWGKTSLSDEMAHCYCGSTDLRPQPSGETQEGLDAFLDRLNNENVRYMARVGGLSPWIETFKSDLRALLSARPLALGGQQGDSETLRVLLDNLVIAQTLSKDLRQKATDEARSYLYELRHAAPVAETAGEAVAWRWHHKSEPSNWRLQSTPFYLVKGSGPITDYVVQPLYATPVPAQDDDKLRIPAKWFEVAEYATERGLAVHESNMRMEEFRRVVTPAAVLSVSADEEIK